MFNLRRCCTASLHNGPLWISLLLAGSGVWSCAELCPLPELIELSSTFCMDNMRLASHWSIQGQCLAFATSKVPIKPSVPLFVHGEPHIPILTVCVLYPSSYFGIEFYWHTNIMWQFSTPTIIHRRVYNITPYTCKPLVQPITVQDAGYPLGGGGTPKYQYMQAIHVWSHKTNVVLLRVWFSDSLDWESKSIEIIQFWSSIHVGIISLKRSQFKNKLVYNRVFHLVC